MKKDGYEIEAVQNRGYRIVGTPDILSENELSSIRKTDWIGKKSIIMMKQILLM